MNRVDVGDVLGVVDGEALGLQVPDEHVERHIKEGVTQVGGIVGGDTADVQCDGRAGLERLQAGG